MRILVSSCSCTERMFVLINNFHVLFVSGLVRRSASSRLRWFTYYLLEKSRNRMSGSIAAYSTTTKSLNRRTVDDILANVMQELGHDHLHGRAYKVHSIHLGRNIVRKSCNSQTRALEGITFGVQKSVRHVPAVKSKALMIL